MTAPIDDREAIAVGRAVIAERQREQAEREAVKRRDAAAARRKAIEEWTARRDLVLERARDGAHRFFAALASLDEIGASPDGSTADPVEVLRQVFAADVKTLAGVVVFDAPRLERLIFDALIRPRIEGLANREEGADAPP